MNCEIVQGLLDSAEAEIPEAMLQQINAHLARCSACDRVWRAKRLLDGALRSVSGPDMPEGFAERIFPRVFATAEQRRRKRLAVAFGFAAVLVLGVALGFMLSRQLAPAPDYVVRSGKLILQSEHPTIVQVAFNAGTALDNVHFSIDLPDGVQIAGQPGQRHLNWVGQLRKGRNLLKLPVVAAAGVDGRIIAKLSRGDARRVFSVEVVAQDPAPLPARMWYSLARSLHWQS